LKRSPVCKRKRPEPLWDTWLLDMWAPPPLLTVDVWAEQHVVLPRQVSAEPGKVNLDRNPYLREILRAATDPDVEEITLCASTQVGKTLAAVLVGLYYMDQDPWPILHVMPREDDAHKLNTERYQPIIRESPQLRRHLTGAVQDLVRTSIRLNGATITFAGSNSPAALASRAICVLILDETDKYPAYSGKEADPVKLARERTRTFLRRKILKVSTPTTDYGYIWREYQESDRRRYYVPCPHCGGYQALQMGSPDPGTAGVKWPAELSGDPEKILDLRAAWYECAHCKGEILDIHRHVAVLKGIWVPQGMTIDQYGQLKGTMPSRRRTGYHLSALYSPWLTWSDIAAEFLRSRKHASSLMNFRNSWLAEIWREQMTEVTGAELRRKCGDYVLGEVPEGAMVLTCGIDVQESFFAWVVRAWGAGGKSWLVRYGMLHGWQAVEELLKTRFTEQKRGVVHVLRWAFVDSGYKTEEVYRFCGRHRPVAWPSKGTTSTLGTVVKLSRPGDGVLLTNFKADFWKDRLAGLIRGEKDVPGAWLIPKDVGNDYLEQMTAEKRVIIRQKGMLLSHWEPVSDRAANHFWDCEVLNVLAADRLQVQYLDAGPEPPDRPQLAVADPDRPRDGPKEPWIRPERLFDSTKYW